MISRESLKTHWKEIEAFKNGEVIEYAIFSLETTTIKWLEDSTPSWEFSLQYRVKPKFHLELRKAHKAGADMQYWCKAVSMWVVVSCPVWDKKTQYRIKPKESDLHQIRWLVEIIAHSQGKAIEVSFDNGLSWNAAAYPAWKLGHLYQIKS